MKAFKPFVEQKDQPALARLCQTGTSGPVPSSSGTEIERPGVRSPAPAHASEALEL